MLLNGTCLTSERHHATNTPNPPQDNTADNGGSIFSTSVSNTVTATGCWFRRNRATARGGALRIGSTLAVQNCSFHGNVAASGGAVYGTPTSAIWLDDAVATDNSASSTGGVLAVSGKDTLRTASRFKSNTAAAGGAVYAVNVSNVVVHDSLFGDNSGSGLFAFLASYVEVRNSATKASRSAEFELWYVDSAVFSHCSLVASASGQALVARNSNVTMYNSLLGTSSSSAAAMQCAASKFYVMGSHLCADTGDAMNCHGCSISGQTSECVTSSSKCCGVVLLVVVYGAV